MLLMMMGLEAMNGANVGGARTGAVGDRVGDEEGLRLGREVDFLKNSRSRS